jgi:glycosyltransferase involved in cell wall biosynthesis
MAGSGPVVIVSASDLAGNTFGGTESIVISFLRSYWRDRQVLVVGSTRVAKELGLIQSRHFGECHPSMLPVAHIVPGHRGSVRWRFVSGLFGWRGELRRFRPSVIYAHSPEIALACGFIWRGSPVVLHCHGTDNPMRLSRFGVTRMPIVSAAYDRLVLQPALRAAARVIVTASHLAFEHFLKKHNMVSQTRCVRIPSMIDPDVFRTRDRLTAREWLGIAPEIEVVVSVARLERPKRVDVLVAALREMREEGRNVILVVAGDGGHRAALERMVVNNGLTHAVRFLGYVKQDSLGLVLAAADVFATASEREGFSVALLEAMASGLPVVSTPVGGAPEVVKDGENGYLARTGSPSEFAWLITKALEGRKDLGVTSVRTAEAYASSVIGREIAEVLSDAAMCGGSVL